MGSAGLEQARIGKRMRTYSGRYVHPLDPRAWEISLDDIAHHLAMLCRWTGSVRSFYSVAQHAVIVARLCPEELQAAALLHDAAEAYLGDDAKMVKEFLWVGAAGDVLRTINECEHPILRETFLALGVTWPDAAGWAAIKQVDTAVAGAEARDLFDHDPEWEMHQAEVPKAAVTIRPLGPVAAETLFREAWAMMRNS